MSAPEQDRSPPPPYGRFAMGPVRGDRLPALPYSIARDEPGAALEFATASSRRWGQARLHAAGAVVPIVALGFAFLFLVALTGAVQWLIPALGEGALAAAAVLAVGGFFAGRRSRVSVRADRAAGVLEHTRVPPLGRARVERVPLANVAAFEIHALLRTLGADLELMVLLGDGREVALGQGDPHTGQLRALGEKLAAVAGVELRVGEPR